MFGDFIPEIPGIEFAAAQTSPTAAAQSTSGRDRPPGMFGFFAGPSAIMKYKGVKIGEFEGRIVSVADVIGDWREEIIVIRRRFRLRAVGRR